MSRMKRSLVARKPARTIPAVNQEMSAGSAPASDARQGQAGSNDKTWEVDGPEGIPVPVIRANTISFRVSYQGRIQVAFFEEE